MKIKLFFLVIFVGNIFSQNLEYNFREALNAAYNFEFNRANKITDLIIDKYPDHPAGYHLKSSIFLWQYLGNSEQVDFDSFLVYSDKTIRVGESLLKNNHVSDAEFLNFILGANYGYRAIANGKAENYLDMIWASKNSNSYLTKTKEINKDNYDVYLGLGLFKFALGQVPPALNWALNLIGFHGNLEEGLMYLRRAAEKGNYSKVEAQYYLAQIYSEFFLEYKQSKNLLSKLTNQFPNNMLFRYTEAVVDIKQKNLSSAEKNLRLIVKNKELDLIQLKAFSHFLLGDINFRQNKFEDAINEYQRFLSLTKDKSYTGIANYRLALSIEITESFNDAKVFYQKGKNGNLSIEDDSYAKRKCEQRLKTSLTDVEIKFIQYRNLFEAGNLKGLNDSLNLLLQEVTEQELSAEISLTLSELNFELKNYEDALNHAIMAFQIKIKNEKWIKPYAYYYAAASFFQLGNKIKCEEFISEAQKITDYDYQSKLKSLLKNLKSKLNS